MLVSYLKKFLEKSLEVRIPNWKVTSFSPTLSSKSNMVALHIYSVIAPVRNKLVALLICISLNLLQTVLIYPLK